MPNLPDSHDAKSASSAADRFERGLIEATSRLKRYALSLYRDHITAEDAVQETLCCALANRHRFAPDTNLFAWLATILRHAFCAGRKSVAAKYLSFTGDRRYADHTSDAGDPERLLIFKELVETIDALKPQHRDALFDSGRGYTLDEMVERLGVCENTVKSHISRGRAKLVELTGGAACLS